MVEGTSHYTNADTWCIGILLYEFLVGSPPFESNSQNETYKRIVKCDIKYPEHVSPGARDLIGKVRMYHLTSHSLTYTAFSIQLHISLDTRTSVIDCQVQRLQLVLEPTVNSAL